MGEKAGTLPLGTAECAAGAGRKEPLGLGVRRQQEVCCPFPGHKTEALKPKGCERASLHPWPLAQRRWALSWLVECMSSGIRESMSQKYEAMVSRGHP